MSAKPFADVYEKAKELRRHGKLDSEIRSRLEAQLLAMFRDLGREKQDFVQYLEEPSVGLWMRIIDIMTLADRVFGNDEKAEAWLVRPNASLSGQTPMELLIDELGAAIVREMLERIDHGIFA